MSPGSWKKAALTEIDQYALIRNTQWRNSTLFEERP